MKKIHLTAGESEFEKDDDHDDLVHTPLGFKISDISIKTEQQSADFIIDMLKHNEIDMDTPFQRSPDLWKPDVMSRFIESMMLKFPLPPLYFDISYKVDKSGKENINEPYWQVVDGLQRLSTIRRFVTQADTEKCLKLTGLDFFPDLEGVSYNNLPRSLKRNLHSCQISLFVIYPNTPKKVKHRIFERVNTGGLKLTDQEIRHAINQGRSNEILYDSVDKALRSNGIRIEPGRMRDQELVLRHFAFRLLGIHNYNGSMKLFLDDAMECLDEIEIAKAGRLKSSFINAVSVMIEILGPLAFRKKENGGINRSLFDSYTVVISELSKRQMDDLIFRKDEFLRLYQLSLVDNAKNSKYLESITAATARTDNVLRRFKVAASLVGRVLHD